MRDMIGMVGPGMRTAIAAHPTTQREYKEYLHATKMPVAGAALVKTDSPSAPVTYVSQVNAIAYCRWLSDREERVYRLPTMAELSELVSEAVLEGISPEIWPPYQGARPELRGGMEEIYLCEWTQETETIGQPGGGARVLGSIFYPPWLRQGPNATHAQAHLLASEGYSFVTFRVARDE